MQGAVLRICILLIRGTQWCSWLRHCTRKWKVASLIPDSLIGIFHWCNPLNRSMALGSTPPLTEMSTRNISWGGKGSQYLGLTTLSPSCANCPKIWEPQPPGTPRAHPGLYRDCFTFYSAYSAYSLGIQVCWDVTLFHSVSNSQCLKSLLCLCI
jgi:hypothetical protein